MDVDYVKGTKGQKGKKRKEKGKSEEKGDGMKNKDGKKLGTPFQGWFENFGELAMLVIPASSRGHGRERKDRSQYWMVGGWKYARSECNAGRGQ